MNASCGDVEQVACLDTVVGHHLQNRAILHRLGILFGGQRSAETAADMGTRLGIDHIPHLALARCVVALAGNLLVGVHLQRQILTGIDELHQQREVVAKAAVNLLAHQLATVATNQLRKAFSLIGTLGHLRLRPCHSRQLPALANGALGGGYALVGGNFIAAPHQAFEDGFEFIHRLFGPDRVDGQKTKIVKFFLKPKHCLFSAVITGEFWS